MVLYVESHGLRSGRRETDESESKRRAGNQRTITVATEETQDFVPSVMNLDILRSLSPHRYRKKVGQITHLDLLELREELRMKFDEVG